MEGMLSQDEINALLSGMELPGDEEESISSAEPDNFDAGAEADDEYTLTDVEKDAVGEVANISLGTSATTLYSLVNKKVNITTPTVVMATWDDIANDYERPCVFIQIKYTRGLEGSNILILKEQDVKIITDLMMGGDGINVEGEIGELHLSAISEAMNQMMGSSATSLSTMMGTLIDISPPVSTLLDLHDKKAANEIASFLSKSFVKITFSMQIGDLVDSTIMQLYPIDFAKSIYKRFMGEDTQPAAKAEPTPYVPPKVEQSSPAPVAVQQEQQMGASQMGMPQMGMQQMGAQQMGMPQMGMPQMGMQQMGMPQMGIPQMGMPQMGQGMDIQPAQFQSFANGGMIHGQENIGLIMDVPLEVTVELGRTNKAIGDILDFAPGTIIELDKIAGEPVDVLVNGKFVARGEVVVIEESFGVRVTEIIR